MNCGLAYCAISLYLDAAVSGSTSYLPNGCCHQDTAGYLGFSFVQGGEIC